MIEKVKHSGLALAVLATAQFMVVLDATIVNVALPSIQSALHFDSGAELQWVVTAYSLVFGGFLLLGGRLADLFGRRRLFLIGAMLFAAASLLGGLSQSPEQLILFRSLQGLGGALLAPAALSLVLTIFKEGEGRNKAFGIWSMVAAGGGALGLVLGGILTQYVDWRWVFFINVPLAIAVIFAALEYVPKSLPSEKQRLDVTGAVTITGSLMMLVYALAQAAQHGWGASSTVSMFAVSGVLLVAFIINEMRVRHPLVPLAIFKRRNITGGSIIGLLSPAAMFGMFFYLSIYLQAVLNYSPVQAGLADLPFTIMVIIVAATLSRKMTQLNPKIVLVSGPLIVALGLFLFSGIPVHANYATDILPGMLLMAGGMAIVFVTNTLVTTSGVAHKESGLVSGLLNTGQQIGGAVGLAVLTVVSTTVTKNDILAAGGNPAAVPSALVHGFQRSFLAASLFAIAASIVAMVVIRAPKRSQVALKKEPESEISAIPGGPVE